MLRLPCLVLSLAGALAPLHATSPQPDPALAGHWSFDEGSGSAVLDRTGNNRPGLIKSPGVKWVEGRTGKALRFDGGATQVQVPHSDSLNFGQGHFTISFWVRFDRVSTQFYDTPISKHGIGDPCKNLWTSRGWTIFMEAYPVEQKPDKNWKRDLERAGPFLRLTDGVHVKGNNYPGRCSKYRDDISDGQWHHVVFVRSGDTNGDFKYYCDGVRVEDHCQLRQPRANIDNPDSPLTFGCGFTGDLDEVRVYKRALSDQEIAVLHKNGA